MTHTAMSLIARTKEVKAAQWNRREVPIADIDGLIANGRDLQYRKCVRPPQWAALLVITVQLGLFGFQILDDKLG